MLRLWKYTRKTSMNNSSQIKSQDSWSCNCVGPQNGEPLCPCQMRNVIVRDGRYIQKERDLGPVSIGDYVELDIFKNMGNKNDTTQ